MVAHQVAATVPRLSLIVSPKVDPSADVHEFSLVEGDVEISSGSKVSPGVAITAENSASIFVGDRCNLLPGVVIEGVAGAQVTGSRGTHSVLIEDGCVVAHKSIVHSPAFIGKDCFVGFRSTVFNARIGDGCVIMMHALIQDVEIPPGKCVPSGSVITSQHQADQLPSVRPEDLEFAREILGSSGHAASGRRTNGPLPKQSGARLIPIRSASQTLAQPHQTSHKPLSTQHSYATKGANMQAQKLSPEIVQQVRQYIAQGYKVGMEHASPRRYRSGVWETCPPIQDTREQAVFQALERCLAEHTGEYVRMFGIDTAVKRRVGMVTVQRPDGRPVSVGNGAAQSSSSNSFGNGNGGYQSNGYSANPQTSGNSAGLTSEVKQQVSNLLRSGYIIGTEHADSRRYRSNVWKSCSPIDSTREQEVFSRLQHCLDEHAGEYVRMFGIDRQAKRRVAVTTIQRADGKPVETSAGGAVPAAPSQGNSQSYSGASYSSQSSYSGGSTNSEAAEAVGRILRQGGQIGIEVADARRYRSGIWQTAPSVRSVGEVQKFLNENTDKYVRVFSVNQAQKTRGTAITIQKPGQNSGQSQSADVTTNGAKAARDPIYNQPPHYDDAANQGGMESSVMNQVTQLVNQGFKISVEFADKRRFRSGIWQTGAAIDARRPAEAISALGKQLARHQGDYVRLVGIDPQAKRRVLEQTIQRP